MSSRPVQAAVQSVGGLCNEAKQSDLGKSLDPTVQSVLSSRTKQAAVRSWCLKNTSSTQPAIDLMKALMQSA
jgi:hypothetical protein